MRFAAILMLFLELCVLSAGCGVKGKPLPPLADTPEEQDRLDEGREEAQQEDQQQAPSKPKKKKKRKSKAPSPSPSPSPTPSPTPTP